MLFQLEGMAEVTFVAVRQKWNFFPVVSVKGRQRQEEDNTFTVTISSIPVMYYFTEGNFINLWLQFLQE